MRIFVRAIIAIVLIITYFSCNNADKNAISEDHFTGTTNFEGVQDQFLLGSHLCRESMPPMDDMK
jgi:hypothetical protein